MQHPENSVMSFLNGRFDSLQFTRSVQFWEKFKDGLKYPAVSSVLMGTGHGKDHVAHSATSSLSPRSAEPLRHKLQLFAQSN